MDVENREVLKNESPTRKVARVKRLRNLANLTRKQSCENSEINLNTLIGWEIGRHGGLSKLGAKKFLERIAIEGVICSDEWLLYGVGLGPILSQEDLQNGKSTDMNSASERKIIECEINQFKKSYPNSIAMQVNDDSMLPYFEPNDFVIGALCSERDFDKMMHKGCIVETEDNEILFRKIMAGSKRNHFHLCCYEINPNITCPIFYNVRLTKVAPVIWHRKANVFN